jgi:hypothetical protein
MTSLARTGKKTNDRGALVAFPAEFGVSGVKTFIVNHDGIPYQKDPGPNTLTLARQMTRFDPDKTWKPVQGE